MKIKIQNLLFNFMVAMLFAAIFSLPLVPVLFGSLVVGVLLGFASKHIHFKTGMLCVGIQKEIWIQGPGALLDNFVPSTNILSESDNMSAWVENDKIHWAEIGAEPAVLINNTTYPIGSVGRSDTNIEVILDYFDTTNTVLRSAEEVEFAYERRTSVVNQHKRQLQKNLLMKAAHAFAPNQNTTFLPVINKTDNVFKFEDLIDMRRRFDEITDSQDRIAVLTPAHFAALAKQDISLAKVIMQAGAAQLFGWKIYVLLGLPYYNPTTGIKNAFAQIPTPAPTDKQASLFYVASETMYSIGSADMFITEKDPKERGDIIGFQMRGIAMPKREKYRGAIIA